jgi:hypothetical protein
VRATAHYILEYTVIFREQLESGEDVATCPSCSLMVRVIYDIEKFVKMETMNVSQVTASA